MRLDSIRKELEREANKAYEQSEDFQQLQYKKALKCLDVLFSDNNAGDRLVAFEHLLGIMKKRKSFLCQTKLKTIPMRKRQFDANELWCKT